MIDPVHSRFAPMVALPLILSCQTLWADPGPGQTGSSVKNELLRRELLRMAEDDQAHTLLLGGEDIGTQNIARLKQIISEHGWPGRTLVGKDGARAAWLIAQHADYDLPFQKQCLELVTDAFRWNEVDAEELAYLTDRVLEAQRLPQMYGTQGVGVTSPEHEARVDVNRRALGLEPWRVYVEKLRKRVSVSGSGPTPVKDGGTAPK